ncbi:MAG TPA: sugar transferase [Caulobacteraceae bacterium]|jgi:putative colanic acid biosynthesis UDP-glucose lipid carrier transferase|nr:sugar transferase [Caulobacteraceae bacterium]
MPLDIGVDSVEAVSAYGASGAHKLRSSRAKPTLDFMVALIALFLLMPFLILVALLICSESRGPVLFRQKRTGHNGRPFHIYKFRTMCCLEDGESITQASRDDARITSLGRWLRRTNIDELPQLLNVLRGEMSLVGPRPHALAHDHYYSATVDRYDERFLARPGITGLAQVAGLRGPTPTVDDMAARVSQDLEYIRDWSLGLDFEILARTLMMGPFDPAAF